MKVLINTPKLSRRGGVAAYYHTLRMHLPTDVEYFTIGPRKSDESGWDLLRRFLLDYYGFFKTLRRDKFDIVHLNPSLGSKALVRDGLFLLIAKWLRKKIIVFNHGWDLDYERILRRRWLWLYRRVFFRADSFIVLADEFREKLIEMGCRKPIYLETTTIDDAIFQALPLITAVRKKVADPFNILFLTRIERYKGIYEGLAAYQRLKERFPQVRLIVAGKGSELKGARNYVAEHDVKDVEFTGYLLGSAKQEVFLRSNCYLFPSYGEGMPTSVLEAMAYGLPVITRPVGGLKDFFEDRKMGFITVSLEPEVFAGAIEKMVKEPELCAKMGSYNREFSRERFAASRVAKRIQQIYRTASNL